MKKLGLQRGLFVSAALTLAVGAAAVLGNGWTMSRVLAADTSVGLPAKVSQVATAATDENGISSEAALPGEDATVTVAKTLANGTTIFVSYVYDEKNPEQTVAVIYDYGDGRRETYSYEGEAAAAEIERAGGPKRAVPYSYEEGQPGEGNITRDEAVSAATDALTGKYALRQETLDRFTVTAEFYSVYEDLTAPVWRVYLYPADTDEFSEIGCYTGLIDAKTGEAVQLMSAADGRG